MFYAEHRGIIVSILDTFAPPLQILHRTFDALAALVQDMGVNHRILDVLVTEKFLNCPDVVARSQELRGEGMTECIIFPKPVPNLFSMTFRSPSPNLRISTLICRQDNFVTSHHLSNSCRGIHLSWLILIQ